MFRMTQEEYESYMARHNRLAVQTADLERDDDHAPKAKIARQAVGERVRIRVHSKRRRLIDPDGLYFKAALDGLTTGGLLIDDSADYVEAISYSQERAELEETVITVEAYEWAP